MTAYVVCRVVFAVPLLLFISLVSYALLGLAPGGPVAVLGAASRGLTPAGKAAYLASLGLDKPWYVQYVFWLWNLLHGSLGNSYASNRPVFAVVGEKVPLTLELVGAALLATLIVAIPAGIFAATRRGSALDVGISAAGFAAYGVPSFWLGVVLVQIFARDLHWFPTSGANAIGRTDALDRARHLVLPVITLVVVGFAGWMRYQRGSMLETLGAPFIRTARAKGLSEREVVLKHALRNALIPTITLLGLSLPTLVGGAFLVEYVFSIPGMGYLGINSAFARDYPVVMAITLLSATLVVVGNLLADIGYALVDPRIRYD